MAQRIISVSNKDLLIDAYDSNLKAPAYSGAGTLTVYSISKFAVNQVLCVEEPGTENAEIVLTHAVTAPTGSTVTLASNLLKDHPSDVKVYIIPFDQVEFSYATTATGTPALMSAQAIDPEMEDTIYTDASHSSGFYFTRFKNSILSTFAGYSDAIPFDGFTSNTVGYMIDIAMSESQKVFTKKLTYDGLVREINECLRTIRGELKRWSSSQVFNANLGQAQRGMYRLPLPTDYYNQNSNMSCLDVRVGTEQHLTYVDKQEFDDLMIEISHSTTSVLATVGATTITLSNSADFPATGTLQIYVNNVVQSITYTASDISTGIISGIPASGVGSIVTQIPASTDVWNGVIEGQPQWFTIYGGFIYWWNPSDEIFTGRTLYMDYYTDIIEVNSDGDIIPLTRFDMIKHWLKWTIRNITERNGKPDINDSDFVLFNNALQKAIRRDSTGNKFKMLPKVSGVMYKRNSNFNQMYENYLRD
jgi:hypothetical protein